MGLESKLRATFANKRIFLTGHTGFKGAWLTMLLHELGAEIKGYALKPETESLYVSVKGDRFCSSILHDIRDLQVLRQEIQSFQPDFIFHLAAQPLVRVSYKTPLDTFDVNVMGTINVLETVRSLAKPCVVVVVTTDKVYQNPETGEAFKEEDPLGGYDPYSASKAACEIVVASYRESFFNRRNFTNHQKSIASARAGNVIGGGDWSEDRLIPDVMRAIFSKQKISIRNPKAVRPWQHVVEPLLGYLILAMRQSQEPMRYNEAWNFGPKPENTRSVEEIVKSIISNIGEGQIERDSADHVHEAQLLKLDISKALQLGWEPLLNSEETIQWTVSWYVGIRDNRDSYQMVSEQIQNYFKLLK